MKTRTVEMIGRGGREGGMNRKWEKRKQTLGLSLPEASVFERKGRKIENKRIKDQREIHKV